MPNIDLTLTKSQLVFWMINTGAHTSTSLYSELRNNLKIPQQMELADFKKILFAFVRDGILEQRGEFFYLADLTEGAVFEAIEARIALLSQV